MTTTPLASPGAKSSAQKSAQPPPKPLPMLQPTRQPTPQPMLSLLMTVLEKRLVWARPPPLQPRLPRSSLQPCFSNCQQGNLVVVSLDSPSLHGDMAPLPPPSPHTKDRHSSRVLSISIHGWGVISFFSGFLYFCSAFGPFPLRLFFTCAPFVSLLFAPF